ncbi:Phospholipase_D-nuclease N-terminal [Desulfonatronum zhilinae]|nr:Phospholipase_D-nuclease N-terminal [Desulfonatronum zhilinae]
MGIEVGGILGLIILIVCVWGIIQTIQSTATNGSKVSWVVLILLLPVLGLIIRLFVGPRAAGYRMR